MSQQRNGTSNGSLAIQWEAGGLAAVSKIAAIAVQMGFLILVVKNFSLLDEAFLNVAILVFFGFLVNATMPMRYRLPFFTGLSITSIFVIMGVFNGLWLIGLGLSLIGICHLRFSFRARVLLLLGVALVLSYLRMDWDLYPNLNRMLGGWISRELFAMVGGSLARSGFHVRVPHDRLYARSAVRKTANKHLAHFELFFYAAECLFSSLPGSRLFEIHPRLL